MLIGDMSLMFWRSVVQVIYVARRTDCITCRRFKQQDNKLYSDFNLYMAHGQQIVHTRPLRDHH